MVVNSRPVLGAEVIALSIQCGWIVGLPKDVQYFIISDLIGIKVDLAYFCMACFPGSNILVCGVFSMSTSISLYYVCDAFNPFVNSFDAPEATATKRGYF